MLTYAQVVDLERSLRGSKVLSVFLEGRVEDPAQRHAWRARLDNALDAVRDALRDASHTERETFARCRQMLLERIEPVEGAVRSAGWVSYVTPHGVQLTEWLPVTTPTFAWWGEGIRVVPLLRPLKESRPAIVAVVDSRMARLYRYQGAAVEELDVLRAHAHVETGTHMGAPPRPGFHSGTHGRTGTDEAERELRVGREHLYAELAKRLAELAGPSGWVLVGGTPEPAKEALAVLPDRLAPRAARLPDVHVRATLAEITRAAAVAAATLRRNEDLTAVRVLLDMTAAGGRGSAGIEATRRALRDGRVDRLYLTPAFVERNAADAESLVRSAFDERAIVEEATGEAAALLDAQADGVGAVLRYSTKTQVAEAAAQS